MDDGQREYFNERAAKWDMERHERPQEPGLRRLAARLKTCAGARVVMDAGCGTGVLAPWLLEALPDALVIELDAAEEMLRINRAKYSDARLVRMLGDARLLPFPDDSVEAVVCFQAAPHMGAPHDGLRDMWRVLARGGRMVVCNLSDSAELNTMHAGMDAAVAHDHMPKAERVAGLVASWGGVDVEAEEETGWYWVSARKG